jgi:DNA-binding beta-propeller fold protein YncE
MKRALCAMAIAVVIAGCGGAGTPPTSPPIAANPQEHRDPSATASSGSPAAAREAGGSRSSPPSPNPEALVTAETQNRLVTVDLTSGKVSKSVEMPTDPEFVTAGTHRAVVVSPSAGAVTVVDGATGRPIKVVHGFGSPHIAEIAPNGRYAFVTDDERGQLSVLRLADGRVVGRVSVGPQAHHMAVRSDGRRVWIALGESARTIVIVDTSDPTRPRVVTQFDPGFAVHDLLFTPDGRRVWLTASDDGTVGVFSADSRRLVDRFPGGAPPQHVVFNGQRAYVTSGYGRQLEMVDTRTDRVIKTVSAPYGSFNLSVSDGFVAAASLLQGTLAVYDDQLHLRHVMHIAPAARDVAIWPPQ